VCGRCGVCGVFVFAKMACMLPHVLSSMNRFKQYIVRACALDMGLDSRFDVRIVCLDDELLNEMDSERFVLHGGNVVSYWYYPYMEDRMLAVICKRVRVTICPYCGMGRDGCFESENVKECMTISEIKNHIDEIKQGTNLYQEHVLTCYMRLVDKRKHQYRQRAQKFICHACNKEMSSKQRWSNHCQKRVCIVQKINKMSRKRKHINI